ncbi:MAG: hypothetical protein JWM87_667 [Candidatus Eremiobacteraeota bacterium]|nr:hypothetical protein [Candidatus Eremiobacteraeota bacterium]
MARPPQIPFAARVSSPWRNGEHGTFLFWDQQGSAIVMFGESGLGLGGIQAMAASDVSLVARAVYLDTDDQVALEAVLRVHAGAHAARIAGILARSRGEVPA